MNRFSLIIALIFVILLWILNPILINYYFSDLEKSSQFSDTYNVINSLYSGLGFVAIIYTISMQHKEFQNEISSVNKTNKLSYLTTLLTYYSSEEEKYMGIDMESSSETKQKKEQILLLIEKELSNENESRKV